MRACEAQNVCVCARMSQLGIEEGSTSRLYGHSAILLYWRGRAKRAVKCDRPATFSPRLYSSYPASTPYHPTDTPPDAEFSSRRRKILTRVEPQWTQINWCQREGARALDAQKAPLSLAVGLGDAGSDRSVGFTPP